MFECMSPHKCNGNLCQEFSDIQIFVVKLLIKPESYRKSCTVNQSFLALCASVALWALFPHRVTVQQLRLSLKLCIHFITNNLHKEHCIHKCSLPLTLSTDHSCINKEYLQHDHNLHFNCDQSKFLENRIFQSPPLGRDYRIREILRF